MKEFFASHQYLSSLSIGICFYSVGFFLLYKYRHSILLSSVLALPQALYGLFLVPIYWNPERILIFGMSLEDIIFCFFCGGLAWMGTLFVSKKLVIPKSLTKRTLLRFLVCTAFGFLVTPLLYHIGIKDMVNPFLTMALWITAILIYDRSLSKFILIGSLSFLIIYGIEFKVQMLFWSDFISNWSHENMLGVSLWRIPVEELVWAILYGGSWSLTMAFILDAKFKRKQVISHHQNN